jgi:hypothetical protein
VLLDEETMPNQEFRQLRSFARSVTVGIAEIARMLELLGLSEGTLDALDFEIEQFRQWHSAARAYVEATKASPPPEREHLEELTPLFERTRQRAADFHGTALERQAALEAPHADTDGAIRQGYDTLLEEVAALHNSLNELAWVIGERSADLSERAPGEYANPEDLFRAIGV